MKAARAPLVRGPFLAALAAAAALALVLSALPSPEDRALARWDRAAADYSAGGCRTLQDAKGRARYLEVVEELTEAGAMRRLSALAPLAPACGALDETETKRYLDALFADADSWSTGYPAWKQDILDAYAASPFLTETSRRGLSAVPVEFVFAPDAAYDRLWLEGSWNERGRRDDLRGWKDAPMTRAPNGAWTRRSLLALTRVNDPYHAVVRTAPWPRGRTVGYAVFRVDGPSSVRLAPVPAAEPASAPAAPAPGPRTKVSVLGVDGATWHVIMPLVRLGRLPNFRRLLDEAALADLWSAGHYGSLENIHTAFSGKLPFRNGKSTKNYMRLQMDRKPAKVWKIVSDAGLKALVVCAWETFPPEAFSGKLVTEAFFALELGRRSGVKELAVSREVQLFAERFGVSPANIRDMLLLLNRVDGVLATTWPTDLEAELNSRLPAATDRVEDLPAISRLIDQRTGIVLNDLNAREAFDLSVAYLSEVDNHSHDFWGGFEPPIRSYKKSVKDPRVREAVAKLAPEAGRLAAAYEHADRLIGELFRRSEHLVVFSDHGFGSDRTDYLYLLFDAARFLEDLRAQSGLRLPEGAELQGSSLEFRLWLPRNADSDAYLAALRRRLETTRYLPHGSPTFSEISVETRGDRRLLHFFQEQPRPMFIDGVEVDGRRRSVMDFFGMSTRQGTHKANGMLAVWGAKAKPGLLAEAYMPDLTPTVLRLLDEPSADDMDGRVLSSALKDPAVSERSVPTYGDGGSPLWAIVRATRWKTLLRRLASRD